jgi:HEAT repeat protein
MGISASFRAIGDLPAERRLAFAEAALLEPYPELQAAALEVLADPAGLGRPDLVLPHFPALSPALKRRVGELRDVFLPAARAMLSAERDAARRIGYEAIAALDPWSSASVLARGLEDVSSLIREVVAVLLEGIGSRALAHYVAVRLHGDPASRDFLDSQRAVLLDLVATLVRIFPRHSKRVFLELAVEQGPDAYPLLADAVLARGEPATVRALLQVLLTSSAQPAVAILFRLAAETNPRLREPALEVLRRRTDAGFPGLVAAELARLPEADFDALAARSAELPWWPGVEANPTLDPESAVRILDFVERSAVPPRRKQEMILAFRRSPYPEVRVRVLSALQKREVADLADIAAGCLSDPAEEVQLAAARAVIAANPPNRTRLLAPLLASESEAVRRLAQREVASASFDRLLRSFGRLDPATREAAARALAKIDARILDRLAEETASLDADRRLAALRLVDTLDAGEALRDTLLGLLSDPDRRVRATAVKVVQLAGSPEGRRLIEACLGDPDRRVRANAVEAFEDAGDPDCVPTLLPLLEDADNRVRANAAKALCRFGRPEGRETLEAMLRDDVEVVRLSAVWALGQAVFPGAGELLTSRAAQEGSEAVRAKIAEALERLKEASP